MIHTKHVQGVVSELLAAAYFVKAGCVVSSPIDGHGEYDLVIDDGKTLRKVQVKTIYWDNSKHRHLISCVTSHIRGNARRLNKKYQSQSFDILLGVERESGAIYSVPVEAALNRRSITVYPKGKPSTVNGRHTDFEKYRVQ